MGEVLSLDRLLESLEGNRRLTLRTAQAFPENALFHYAPTQPLRPFAAMLQEILTLEVAIIRGLATGEWTYTPDEFAGLKTKQELLAACETVRQRPCGPASPLNAWWQ